MLDIEYDAYLDDTVNLSELSSVVSQQQFRKDSANYANTWTPSTLNGVSVDVSVMTMAGKLHPNRAYMQLNLTSASPMDAPVVNLLDGSAAHRTNLHDKGEDDACSPQSCSPVQREHDIQGC